MVSHRPGPGRSPVKAQLVAYWINTHGSKYPGGYPSLGFRLSVVGFLMVLGAVFALFGQGHITPADAAVVTADAPVVTAVPVAWERCGR